MLFFLQIISYELENDIGTIPLNLDSGLGFFDALIASLSMILVSEIGDENFIIAALMAMRYPKSTVLSDALSALFVMTVLSTGLGRIVPNLISRKHTNSAATGLPDNVLQKAAAKSIVFEAVYGKHRKESEDNLPVDHCVDRMMMLIPSLLSFTANLSSEADGVRSLTALQRQAKLLTH